MFDIATDLMAQLIGYIPLVFALYILFDLIGGLLFDRR